MVPTRTKRALVALFVLSTLSFWASRQLDPELPGPIEGLDTRFDYTLDHFQMRVFDEQGMPAITINSPRLANDAGTGISTIDAPRLQVHHEGAQWNIMAEYALVSNDQEIVSLNGVVQLDRLLSANTTPLSIVTSDVQLQVTPRLARSDQPVRVTEPGAVISGRGFEVDMIRDQFEIHEQVQGRYDVQ